MEREAKIRQVLETISVQLFLTQHPCQKKCCLRKPWLLYYQTANTYSYVSVCDCGMGGGKWALQQNDFICWMTLTDACFTIQDVCLWDSLAYQIQYTNKAQFPISSTSVFFFSKFMSQGLTSVQINRLQASSISFFLIYEDCIKNILSYLHYLI